MDELEPYTLRPIGVVRSTLSAPADAPNQAFEGAPAAVLEIEPIFADALHRIRVGDELILLTWLHLADRDTLQTHPTGDPTIPHPTVQTRSASTESPSPHSKAQPPYASTHSRRSTAPRSSTSRSQCPTRQKRETATTTMPRQHVRSAALPSEARIRGSTEGSMK
jgi:hypothetical protein